MKRLLFFLLLLVCVASAEFINGRDPAGSTVTANPILMGGLDGGGRARALAVDSNGVIRGSRLSTDFAPVTVGSAGAAVTKTLNAGGVLVRNVVEGIAWSLSGTPSAPVTLTISDGATVVEQWYITNGGPSGVITFPRPLRGSANTAFTATISAPGGSIVATVSFYGVSTE